MGLAETVPATNNGGTRGRGEPPRFGQAGPSNGAHPWPDRHQWRQGAQHPGYRFDPKRHARFATPCIRHGKMDDARKVERLRDLEHGLEHEVPSISKHIFAGLDDILAVVRIGLPLQLRRPLPGTNIMASIHAVVRQVFRNVRRWRDTQMALRWIPPRECSKPPGPSGTSGPTGSHPPSRRRWSNMNVRKQT